MRYFLVIMMSVVGLMQAACGSDESKDSQASTPSSSPVAGAGDDKKADKGEGQEAAPDTDTLVGKPVFHSGRCSGEVGCLRGFISHGTRLTLSPKASGASTDARGEPLVTTTYEFNDAQDFGDRFDSAFLRPLVPAEHWQAYDIQVVPSVRRDNFADGFELYGEGAEANDDRVTMKGEGNFELGDMQAYDQALLRAVKTFRIEIAKNAKAADGTPSIVRAVTCLEIEAVVEGLKIEAGKPTKIGGLRNFAFYYTESDELCRNLSTSTSQDRMQDAAKLPPVGPQLP